jgi:hypothetical protein
MRLLWSDQEISCFHGTSNFDCVFKKAIKRCHESSRIIKACMPNSHFSVTVPSTPRSPKCSLPLRFPPGNKDSNWLGKRAPFEKSLIARLCWNSVCGGVEVVWRLTLGVAFPKHGLISFGRLHCTVTEECITTTQLHGAGPLSSGAARELRLGVGWCCWVRG